MNRFRRDQTSRSSQQQQDNTPPTATPTPPSQQGMWHPLQQPPSQDNDESDNQEASTPKSTASSVGSRHSSSTAAYLRVAQSVLQQQSSSPAKSQDSSDDEEDDEKGAYDFHKKNQEEDHGPMLSSLQQERKPAMPDEQDRRIFVGCLAAVLAATYEYDRAHEGDQLLSAESLAYLEQSVSGERGPPPVSPAMMELRNTSSFSYNHEEDPVDPRDPVPALVSQAAPPPSRKTNDRLAQARRRHQKRRYDVLCELLLQSAEHLMIDKSQAKAFLPMLAKVLVPEPNNNETSTSAPTTTTATTESPPPPSTNPPPQASTTSTRSSRRAQATAKALGAAAAAAKAQQTMSQEQTYQQAMQEIEHLPAFLESLTPGAGLQCLALLLLQHLLHSQVGYDARVRRALKTVGVLVLLHEQEQEAQAAEPDIANIDSAASSSRLCKMTRATRRFESLEHCIAQQLIALSKEQQQQPQQQQSPNKASGDANHEMALQAKNPSRQRLIRSLKIGGTAVAAGALFAVTGGLAAPAIIAGLAGVAGGTAVAAVLSSSVAVTTIFGVGGGSLAAYKMNRRTKGLTEFEFHKEPGRASSSTTPPSSSKDDENGKKELDAELFSTVCISGWLRDDFDFQRPWGVTPSQPPLDHPLELLERFYSVHRPDHVRKCATILESWKEQEDQLWDLIREKYGRDPDHLFPLTRQPAAALTHEQRERVQELFVELGFTTKSDLAASSEANKTSRFPRMTRNWGKNRNDNSNNDDNNNNEDANERDAVAGEVPMEQADGTMPFPGRFDSIHGPNFDEFAFVDVTSVASSGFDSVSTAVSTPVEQNRDTDNTGWPKHLATVWDYTSTYGGEMYTVRWESHLLTEVCDSVADLALGLVSGGAQTLVKHTALAASLGALLTAVAWPAALVQAANMIDGTWTLVVERADEAGKELARSLLFSRAGNRPLTLVGYSFGARAIYSCLKELAKYQEEWEDYQDKKKAQKEPQKRGRRMPKPQAALSDDDTFYETMREPASIVEDVVLMGLPNHLSLLSWKACRQVVAGRLVHCFSQKDLILSLMFQVKRLGIKPVCGTCPVDVAGVENVDVTDLVQGHQDYCYRVGDILKRVRHCEPLRSKPALNYTATLAAELNNQMADEVANLEIR